MGLFDSSHFRFTPKEADWIVHRAIGSAGVVGELLHEFMHPMHRRELFDCMYGQHKKSDWWGSEQRAKLDEACKPYEDGALWLDYTTPKDFERIRAALDRLEERTRRK